MRRRNVYLEYFCTLITPRCTTSGFASCFIFSFLFFFPTKKLTPLYQWRKKFLQNVSRNVIHVSISNRVSFFIYKNRSSRNTLSDIYYFPGTIYRVHTGLWSTFNVSIWSPNINSVTYTFQCGWNIFATKIITEHFSKKTGTASKFKYTASGSTDDKIFLKNSVYQHVNFSFGEEMLPSRLNFLLLHYCRLIKRKNQGLWFIASVLVLFHLGDRWF